MQRRLSKVVTEAATNSIHGKFNHTIAAGLATSELADVAVMLDDILRNTFSDPSVHLVYDGYTRVYPEEAAQEVKKVSRSHGHDISTSDLHMLKFRFRYGEKLENVIEKYRWSPYARPGNMLYLGGTKYMVRPVITDKFISPGSESTFVRLLRDKKNISKVYHACSVNGSRLPDTTVPVLALFSKTVADKVTQCKSTVIHYILGLKGFAGTMAFFGLPPVMILAPGDSVDTRSMDVYESIKSNGTVLRLAVAKENRTTLLDRVVSNIFYIMDMTKVDISIMESIGEWRRLLGSIIYGDKAPVWITSTMMRHYEMLLEAYVPPIMINIIKADFGEGLGEDFSSDGFFKILKVVFITFDSWMSIANEISAVAYDKRYSINYFVLYDTIVRVNELAYKLMEAKQSNRLNNKFVIDHLNKFFTIRGAYKMTHKSNIAVQSISHHVDSYVHKLSTSVAIQLNTGSATGATKSGAKTQADPTTLLHESQLMAGTLAGINASRLSPLSMLNIFAPLDMKTMTIIPTDVDLMHLESLREVLSRTPHRSKTGKLPKLFNRFVTAPTKVPSDW